MKPKVVFDSNVLFQAFVSREGPAFGCLELVEDRRVELFRSRQALRELAEVLARVLADPGFPEIASQQQVEEYLRRIHTHSRPVRRIPQVFRLHRDPRDEPILNLRLRPAPPGWSLGIIATLDT